MPGVDDRLRRKRLDEHADRGDERLPIGARDVGATDRAGEEDVPREETAVRVIREVRRRVTWYREDVERDSRDVDRLTADEGHLRHVCPVAVAHWGQLAGTLEQCALALGHVDRRSGALREFRNTDEVVPVPVRHENRGAARPEPREHEAQFGRVATGVDDRSLVGGWIRADDVAVRPDRAQ